MMSERVIISHQISKKKSRYISMKSLFFISWVGLCKRVDFLLELSFDGKEETGQLSDHTWTSKLTYKSMVQGPSRYPGVSLYQGSYH